MDPSRLKSTMMAMDPSRLMNSMDPSKLLNTMETSSTKFVKDLKSVGTKLDFLKLRGESQQQLPVHEIPPELMLTRV